MNRPMRHTTLRARALRRAAPRSLLAAVAAARGTPAAFATKYPDNRDADVEQMLQRIDAAPRAAGRHDRGRRSARRRSSSCIAYDLGDAQRCSGSGASRRARRRTSRATRSCCRAAGASQGFDLRSGDPRFHIDRGELSLRGRRRRGAAHRDHAERRARARSPSPRSCSCNNDAVQWRRSVDKSVGVPAVVGTMVLVPWSNQFLSAIDVPTGDEFARVRVRDGVIAHALARRRRSTSAATTASRASRRRSARARCKGAGYFALPEQELPGRALLLRDVYTQSAAGAERRRAASHRARVASDRARPRPHRAAGRQPLPGLLSLRVRARPARATRRAGSTSTTPTSSARARRPTASRSPTRPASSRSSARCRAAAVERGVAHAEQRGAHAARRRRRHRRRRAAAAGRAGVQAARCGARSRRAARARAAARGRRARAAARGRRHREPDRALRHAAQRAAGARARVREAQGPRDRRRLSAQGARAPRRLPRRARPCRRWARWPRRPRARKRRARCRS